MAGRFYNILKNLPKDNKLIFDLDKTMWSCTVRPNMNLREISKKINTDTFEILKLLDKEGYSLNIASRSTEPEKCTYFIKNCFKGIQFDNISIFPTKAYKIKHIQQCFKNEKPNKFIMFDDDKKILENLKYFYPNCITVHCDKPINFDTFHKISIPKRLNIDFKEPNYNLINLDKYLKI